MKDEVDVLGLSNYPPSDIQMVPNSPYGLHARTATLKKRASLMKRAIRNWAI